jgi:hypothetical protein
MVSDAAYAARFSGRCTGLASLIADVILVVHCGFIAFVLGGEACVIVGHFRNWHWVRKLTFRFCHLLAIGIVVAQAWADQICPLTVWENALRGAAGEESYSETFVQHWVGRLVYYDAPQWVFTVVYSVFAALVLFSWVWVKPQGRTPDTPVRGDS